MPHGHPVIARKFAQDPLPTEPPEPAVLLATLGARRRVVYTVVVAQLLLVDHWSDGHRLIARRAIFARLHGVRPMNRIFKRVYWRGRMFGAPSARHWGRTDAIAPISSWAGPGTNAGRDKAERLRGGAHNHPVLVWDGDEPGAQVQLVSSASPAWRNSCQRSGSSSSIRRAGCVLIRSSTSWR